MATFRLAGGGPAPFLRSGPPARSELPDTHPGMFYPNREADTSLKCGCKIPWPVVQSFGGHTHGKIWCDVHGWQDSFTKKQIDDAKREGRKCHDMPDQLTPDLPPF